MESYVNHDEGTPVFFYSIKKAMNTGIHTDYLKGHSDYGEDQPVKINTFYLIYPL
ncbi:hypothetical protein [Metabacillus indicus]|nr:hypothetical protein [Metabacillus indicus]